MHASETISLVYPEPLNLQDQKVFAMNSDFAKSLSNKLPRLCTNIKTNSLSLSLSLSLFVPPAVRSGARITEGTVWMIETWRIHNLFINVSFLLPPVSASPTPSFPLPWKKPQHLPPPPPPQCLLTARKRWNLARDLAGGKFSFLPHSSYILVLVKIGLLWSCYERKL